eukprot:CAMPEP_0113235158 /NCGR_PEP_ID=MMETSP0008_2-20120614/3410_1 /TAXON_ID=97485 /ORGANISM="Prymnesium parvum" /LENGTH=116 /DNA_ID=CAMNT_0000082073 /DNA_START=205 /DNA_END=555 /DNA_ORIENTATION=- /assembly_acc=CAM_ASM_000153
MRSSQAIALSPSLRQFSPELLRRRRPLGGLQLRVESPHRVDDQPLHLTHRTRARLRPLLHRQGRERRVPLPHVLSNEGAALGLGVVSDASGEVVRGEREERSDAAHEAVGVGEGVV